MEALVRANKVAPRVVAFFQEEVGAILNGR
jgi:hypothetical protein